ncbi:MAG: CBS domain-containing protein [Acidobacteria bacterium]|nr:CBS domain-containing protein [Acidobacteriota bacterium]
MKVQNMMTNNVKSCSPDTNLSAAASMMWDADCGVLPVINETGRVVGLITDRDIAIAVATMGRLASDIAVREVTSGQVYAISPDDDIKAALKQMQQGKVRRLPVVNNEGILLGILSLNDIVLRVEELRTKQIPGLTHEEIVGTCKAIFEHRKQQAARA